MLDSPAIAASPATDLPVVNGRKPSNVAPRTPLYLSYSTLADLPGDSTILGPETTGEELGQLFSQQPDLSGAILFDESGFAGVISQSHFYKCVSRAFGREIYYRRSAMIMLTEVTIQTLLLSSDSPIQTAVEKCLARPTDHVYEPFLVYHRESGEYRLCAFQVLLLASSQIAALRNRQMEQILHSVTDGLLVIDRNFRIGSEYSRVVGQLLEQDDLRHASLPEVLHPLLDGVTYEQLQDYLRILFDPKLIDRLIKSINPARQISIRFSSGDIDQEERVKHLALNFERIRTQTEISQVLVQIEDITHQINLSKELALQEVAAEEKLHLVMQILQVEPIALNRFITQFNQGLSAFEQMLRLPAGTENPRDMIHAIFRRIHTLKGDASLLRLGTHESLLHQVEDELDKLRSAAQLEAGDLASLEPSLEALQRLSDQIHQILDQVKSLDTTPQARAESGTRPKAGLMESISLLVSANSERLGKPAVFYTTVKEADLPGEYAEVLRDILPHLVRNSIVHGIEPTEERVARGKNPLGIIQFDLRSHPEFYEFIFQDDGGGLDFDRIRLRAAQLGWHLPTEDDLRHAIFEPGFSTAEAVSDLAGRGVGLDAIRDTLKKAGGRIIPHSHAGAYCAFQILLPKLSPSSSS